MEKNLEEACFKYCPREIVINVQPNKVIETPMSCGRWHFPGSQKFT
jgi:hypothetical protein